MPKDLFKWSLESYIYSFITLNCKFNSDIIIYFNYFRDSLKTADLVSNISYNIYHWFIDLYSTSFNFVTYI